MAAAWRQKSSDPRSYYAILGIAPDADEAAVKAAFRRQAKLLHPDRNPDADAEARFRLLSEAYRVIGDPEARRRYDRREDLLPRSRPEPRPGPGPEVPPEPAGSGFHACDLCGRRTAQPRAKVYFEAGGRPFAATLREVGGVFCPRCGEKTAISASLHSWVRGMTALPGGPLLALPALLRNLAGGREPVEANARLLLAQARAFLGQGEIALARASILQALPYAERTAYRHEALTLLAAIGGEGAKPLRNRWHRLGRGFWVQVLPFAGVAAALALAVVLALRTVPSPSPPPSPVRTLVMLPSGPNLPLPETVIAGDGVTLWGGPGRLTANLGPVPKGMRATVTAVVAGDDWVRVRLADGREGFVSGDDLKP